MTPREKWREECMQYLINHGWQEWIAERKDDATLNQCVIDALADTTERANYLTSEYIINVKKSDDEKGTEISDNQQQQW